MCDSEPKRGIARIFGKIHLTVGVSLGIAWFYFGAVFLLDNPDLPIRVGFSEWPIGALLSLGAGCALASWLFRFRAAAGARLVNVCLITGVVVVSLVILDTLYGMYVGATISNAGSAESRHKDSNVWVGEFYPPLYYPSERNFRLHKPNITVSGTTYGSFYRDPMQRAQTLVQSVLEKRAITVQINELGFRESAHIADAEIFTLGDSFTFGWGVNESESWPHLLEKRLGRTVYNLGILDATPKQELELLRHVLKGHTGSLRVEQVLWMIYESNDLQGNYEDHHRHVFARSRSEPKFATIVEWAKRFPRVLKQQSVIHKVRTGQLTWKPLVDDQPDSPYSVDGVELVHPIFYSEQFGPKLFFGPYVEQAGAPRSSVQEHRNWPRLEVVFREMAQLAEEFDFSVAVIIAPGARDAPESRETWRLQGILALEGSFSLSFANLLEGNFQADLAQGWQTLRENQERMGHSAPKRLVGARSGAAHTALLRRDVHRAACRGSEGSLFGVSGALLLEPVWFRESCKD